MSSNHIRIKRTELCSTGGIDRHWAEKDIKRKGVWEFLRHWDMLTLTCCRSHATVMRCLWTLGHPSSARQEDEIDPTMERLCSPNTFSNLEAVLHRASQQGDTFTSDFIITE